MNRLEIHKEKKRRRKIPKGVSITIVSFVIVVFVGACIFYFRPTYISPSDSASRKIAESYLDKQITLEDYNVESVNVIFYNNDKILEIDYSVRPKEEAYDKWCGSDGEKDEDGMVKKHSYIRYYKIGNIYFTGINANTGL